MEANTTKHVLASALKACRNEGLLRDGRTTHDYIIRKGLDTETILGTAIVDMYAKCGSFEEARRAFDSCPSRDVISWNALISAYIDHDYGLLALQLFHDMQNLSGFLPNKVSFILALKACTIEDNIHHGRNVHDCILRSGIPLDCVCGSSLIDMYAKMGHLNDACSVFHHLPIKNVFSWGALMSGYVQHGCGSKAFDLFKKIQLSGLQPNPVIMSCILKACSLSRDLLKGMLVHDLIMQYNCNLDPVVCNALVDMYSKCGEFEESFKLLYAAPCRSVRSWGALIGGLVQNNQFFSALNLFVKMQEEGTTANHVLYSCILRACGNIEAADEGRILHHQVLKYKMEANEDVTNSIIDMYANFGSLFEAQKTFDIIPRKTSVSWDAIMLAYMKGLHCVHVLEYFEKMQQEKLKPTEAIFTYALKACGILRDTVQGRSVHGKVVVNIFAPDVIVVNSLIDMYLRCGCLDEGKNVFEKSKNLDVVSWNSIIGGFVQSDHFISAFDMFDRMLHSGNKPDRITYLCMIKACRSIGALPQGRFVYDQIIKGAFESDVAMRISLVDMFASCGSFNEAHKLLDGSAGNDAASWAAMIAGYSKHSECDMARECFYEMQKRGHMPDVATFTVILVACCHAGQVEEGYWYFNAMKRDYGITPKAEHFNCVIDLLGRVGRLADAHELLKTMPEVADIMGWTSLLNACKRYGDIELARECSEAIVQIDPDNSAVYTLMSNVCADSMVWDDVGKLGSLRECANAWKTPATMWSHTESNVHEFVV